MSRRDRAVHPRISPLAFAQLEDLKVLNSLIDELAVVLEDNREATDELCRIADELSVEDEDDNELEPQAKTFDEIAESGEYHSASMSVVNLRLQNESLQKQVRIQRIKTASSTKLLKVCVYSLDKCLAMVRELAYKRTMHTLEVHKDHIKLVQAQQDKYQKLAEKHAILEDQVFKISRALGVILDKASSYKDDVSTSVDFVSGVHGTMATP